MLSNFISKRVYARRPNKHLNSIVSDKSSLSLQYIFSQIEGYTEDFKNELNVNKISPLSTDVFIKNKGPNYYQNLKYFLDKLTSNKTVTIKYENYPYSAKPVMSFENTLSRDKTIELENSDLVTEFKGNIEFNKARGSITLGVELASPDRNYTKEIRLLQSSLVYYLYDKTPSLDPDRFSNCDFRPTKNTPSALKNIVLSLKDGDIVLIDNSLIPFLKEGPIFKFRHQLFKHLIVFSSLSGDYSNHEFREILGNDRVKIRAIPNASEYILVDDSLYEHQKWKISSDLFKKTFTSFYSPLELKDSIHSIPYSANIYLDYTFENGVSIEETLTYFENSGFKNIYINTNLPIHKLSKNMHKYYIKKITHPWENV